MKSGKLGQKLKRYSRKNWFEINSA